MACTGTQVPLWARICGNPSGDAWAKFYAETHPDCDVDEMRGWFGNAMMAMHDHIHQNNTVTPK